ncbi:MAG TPA: FUSC family protein [Beijerinckiaceae bacterium]|nr:FUSC family protein [Beijerinckiaceae bacterium]
MAQIAEAGTWLLRHIRENKPRLRLSLRVTVSAIATLIVADWFDVPLGGLWAVLTAVIVTQMSIGSSLKATIEYTVGTLGGAIYAGAIATLVPPVGIAASFGDLAVALAPLAFLAAFNANFRVAPFTAVIVVVGSTATHASPVTSALYRVAEVILGGGIGLVVSYLVFPERAHALARVAAARMLELMARALPELMDGVIHGVDHSVLLRVQNAIGDALSKYNAAASEARHERLRPFSPGHQHGPLSRTLLRLRHDFVIIGRASIISLPQTMQSRLVPLLDAVADASADYLHQSSFSLIRGRAAPPTAKEEAAFAAFADAIVTLRQEGATRGLPADAVEHFFILSFVFDQIGAHFKDLARCIDESSL